MKIIKLNVPFHQKDQAKKLGAKWNWEDKFWFITEQEDSSLFAEWLQDKSNNVNIKAPHYYIAQSFRNCWECSFKSQVYAIVLQPERPGEYAKILYFLQYLNEGAKKRLEKLTPYYSCDTTSMVDFFYWMNHCQQCKAKFGDFETIEEYSSPFRPKSIDEAKGINLHYVKEPLEAFGDSSRKVAFLGYMNFMPDPLPVD